MNKLELKSSQRGTYWKLLVEDFGSKVVYIKGPKNIVSNPLNKLSKQGDSIVNDVESKLPFVCKDEEIFPIQLQLI